MAQQPCRMRHESLKIMCLSCKHFRFQFHLRLTPSTPHRRPITSLSVSIQLAHSIEATAETCLRVYLWKMRKTDLFTQDDIISFSLPPPSLVNTYFSCQFERKTFTLWSAFTWVESGKLCHHLWCETFSPVSASCFIYEDFRFSFFSSFHSRFFLHFPSIFLFFFEWNEMKRVQTKVWWASDDSRKRRFPSRWRG